MVALIDVRDLPYVPRETLEEMPRQDRVNLLRQHEDRFIRFPRTPPEECNDPELVNRLFVLGQVVHQQLDTRPF